MMNYKNTRFGLLFVVLLTTYLASGIGANGSDASTPPAAPTTPAELTRTEVRGTHRLSVCHEYQFKCWGLESGVKCIPNVFVCNGRSNCQDGSDEINCDVRERCTYSEFACDNGQCIDVHLHCDNYTNCADGSDEVSCEAYKKCSAGTFFCNESDACIMNQWVCDGDEDCDNGEDEAHCPENITAEMEEIDCEPDGFFCPTDGEATCIHLRYLCDGVVDCDDGSDEEVVNCPVTSTPATPASSTDGDIAGIYMQQPGFPSCLASYFRCDSHECIPFSQVCDFVQHCRDGSDEGPVCVSACESNGGCSHICQPTPEGSHCICPSGYTLEHDLHLCTDIDECDEDTTLCSQHCENSPGSYVCQCEHGYVLDLSGHKCKAQGGEAYVLVSVSTSIYRMQIDGQHLDLVMENDEDGIIPALDVSMHNDDFYWMNMKTNSIDHYVKHRGTKVPFLTDISSCNGIAVDWIAHVLYYTEAGDTPAIHACSLDSSLSCTTVLTGEMDLPYAIAVDPHSGELFWSDVGIDTKIERVWMDGQHRQILVSSSLVHPNDLTLDLVLKRVYWLDANQIESINYDGTGRRLIYQPSVLRSFGMTFFNDYLFWTDSWHGTVTRINKLDGSNQQILVTNLKHPVSIKAVHPVLQRPGHNHCHHMKSRCSHLCLLHPKGASCHCPEGMYLSPTNSSLCFENKTQELDTHPANSTLCSTGLLCYNGGNCLLHSNGSTLCSCPVGFTGSQCDNRTGVFLAYPLLAGNSYAWVAGVLSILVLSIIGIIVGIYCCRRKKRQHANEAISIIKFRNALLRRGSKSEDAHRVFVDASSFDNPGYTQPEDDENANNPKTSIAMSSSIDSIDSAFLSRHDDTDPDNLSTKPLTNAENYDSS